MKQKILIFIVATFIAFGCASSKKAVDISIGEWEYVVQGTPEGDVNGIFVISKDGDAYTGALVGDEGNTPLNDLTIVEKVLNCTFDYSGYIITMTGTFEGDNFTGKCSVEYNDFPMTAVRKQ